jgi:2-dehydropantoate 2-reductase
MARVCVAGAGVIGSLFAAHLARVAEVSALTRREEHAEALRTHGLRVSGRADFTAQLAAATSPDDLATPELVILACKGTDLETVAARLAGHWPDAVVMTVQNGIGADEVVARHGAWRILARGTTYADAQSVAELIVSSGLAAEAFEDLRPAQWSKLIFNATVNTVAALTGLPHDPHFAALGRPDDLGHLVKGLMDEGKAVAAAAGVELGEDPWEMNVLATRRGSAHYPSMLEDVDAHRRTEIDMITGALVREAHRVGVPVPLHETMERLIKAKEDSWS